MITKAISILVLASLLATLYLYIPFPIIVNNSRRLQEALVTPPKAFDKWDRSISQFPCVPANSPDTEGFFYVKVPKTSSSTLGKITSRIAGREAKRRRTEICKIYEPTVHHKAFELSVSKRDKSRSFLWSVIRHPSDRAVSHFGMRVKFGQMQPTDKKFIEILDKGVFDDNVQLRFLSPVIDPTKVVPDEFPFVVSDILNEYNFIGTYERLYESLVVLSMLADIDMTDVLFDFLPSKHTRCGSLQKPDWLTSGMEEYLNSESWRNREKGDYMLYDTIDKSLDMTIEKLGKKNVEEKLEKYLKLLDLGTGVAQKSLGRTGCGIPGLHPQQDPYADVQNLFWYEKLADDDKNFIKTL